MSQDQGVGSRSPRTKAKSVEAPGGTKTPTRRSNVTQADHEGMNMDSRSPRTKSKLVKALGVQEF